MDPRAKGLRRLGLYLKDQRLQAGLSQGDVSRALNYTSAQSISNFERGLSSPPLSVIKELIRLYKIPARKLIALLVSIQKELIEESLLEWKEESKHRPRSSKQKNSL